MEVVVLRAQGLSYTEIQRETGMDRMAAWRLFHRADARNELIRVRLSVIDMLDEAAPQFVRTLSGVAEDEGAETKDRVSAAKGGLQALAALKRADAASRVADVEEKRALSPDELAEGRERLMESVRLRLVGE
jgi:hypothetical protein